MVSTANSLLNLFIYAMRFYVDEKKNNNSFRYLKKKWLNG